jgi:hypothetical protein
MDIVKIVRARDFTANFWNLTLKQKFFLLLFLMSFISVLLPHESLAAMTIPKPQDLSKALAFDANDNSWKDWIKLESQNLTIKYKNEQALQKALRQERLADMVQRYLQNQRSPLADYASTLITLKNWKKIVALSNAESSMCRNYQEEKANCWGVGGANLWDMGTTLEDGIVSMNAFLNKYPKNSRVKYSQMTFAKMNGLYKQPPADHWLYNNQSVFDDLTAIENSL